MEERYGPGSQWLVCAIMCAVGLLLMRFAQHAPLPQALVAGMDWPLQLGLGAAGGAVVGAGSLYTALFQSRHKLARRTAESYALLDLRGLNPVWISLAAGIGEETLFRAGLQPLLGLWPAALLFTVLHLRVYDFKIADRVSWMQAGGVFAMGVALGLVFEHVGLIAAIAAHAVIDIFGLYAVKIVDSRDAGAPWE
ncbi:type II CAAX prenyl endopeptidase Rce1 family protein [Pseudoduganella sp. UC29_106]|uniref:CPBP family glutamic-type intramembrane protease n=1 Tax=Pseudoduganella sp. UC29_106 TaxID=3374553 RepID=UPI00375841CA